MQISKKNMIALIFGTVAVIICMVIVVMFSGGFKKDKEDSLATETSSEETTLEDTGSSEDQQDSGAGHRKHRLQSSEYDCSPQEYDDAQTEEDYGRTAENDDSHTAERPRHQNLPRRISRPQRNSSRNKPKMTVSK